MGMPKIVQYPLDLTATSPTNLIVGEERDIFVNTERAFVPVAGSFYAESFKIVDADTDVPLVPVDDYVLAQPHSQAALRSGRDVQSVVVLKIQAPRRVRYQYQAVGGEYSWNLEALVNLISELNLDERPVKWGSIVGRPLSYPPAPHMHDIGDTYGWEYVVWELERISNAILVGDEASHDELRAQIVYVRDTLQFAIDEVADRLATHAADDQNPHSVTKAQVGLGQVDDFPTASAPEALAGTLFNRFMTPATTALLADRIATEEVAEHNANKTNPHEVTKAQVGLGQVDDFPTATRAEAESRTVNNRFMTPERTYQAIMIHAGTMLDAHIANKANPHNVTKAQVGLGQVDNFPTASTEEAKAGIANNRFLTPMRLKEVLDELLGVINDRLESDSIANEQEHDDIRALIESMRTELSDLIRRSGQKQIISVDTTAEIFNNYVITANCRVKLPAKDGLSTGDMVLFWKLPSVEPVIWSDDTVIDTINGTDAEVLYNKRDSIACIYNAATGKWEI